VPEKRDRLPNGETMIYDVSKPTLELFRPASGRANRTAVIIAPGNGFVALSYTFGGTDVALAARGITAFVLKYRTIRSGDSPMDDDANLSRTSRRKNAVLSLEGNFCLNRTPPPF
jgi:hypothetical protein